MNRTKKLTILLVVIVCGIVTFAISQYRNQNTIDIARETVLTFAGAGSLVFQQYGEGYIVVGFSGTLSDEVVIPATHNERPVVAIGDEAFWNSQLTSVVIPDSVISIGRVAFMGARLTSLVIPDSVTTIGGFAFHGNQLTSVIIGNSVTSIINVSVKLRGENVPREQFFPVFLGSSEGCFFKKGH